MQGRYLAGPESSWCGVAGKGGWAEMGQLNPVPTPCRVTLDPKRIQPRPSTRLGRQKWTDTPGPWGQCQGSGSGWGAAAVPWTRGLFPFGSCLASPFPIGAQSPGLDRISWVFPLVAPAVAQARPGCFPSNSLLCFSQSVSAQPRPTSSLSHLSDQPRQDVEGNFAFCGFTFKVSIPTCLSHQPPLVPGAGQN